MHMPLLARSKLWGKGHITVPNEVRKLLGLGKGDYVEWIYEDGKVVVKKASTSNR